MVDTGANSMDGEIQLSEGQQEDGANYQQLKKTAEEQQAALEAQKATIDAQTELAKAQIEQLTAGLQTSEAARPSGEVSIGDVGAQAGFLAEMVALQAMRRGAKQVGDLICALENLGDEPKILIVDSLEFAHGDYPRLQISYWFDFYERQLEYHVDTINAILQPTLSQVSDDEVIREKILSGELTSTDLLTGAVAGGPALIGAAVSAAPTLLGAAADIMSFFKIDYQVQGRAVDLPLEALMAGVAGHIAGSISTQIFGYTLLNESTTLERYRELIEKRFELSGLLASLRKNTQDDEGEETTNHDFVISNVEATLDAFDGFVKEVQSASEGQEQALLLQAASRGYIRDEGFTHLLFLNVVSQGGEIVTKKGLFGFGGKMAYLGGCAVSYVLAEANGRILTGDTIVEASEMPYEFTRGAKVSSIRTE